MTTELGFLMDLFLNEEVPIPIKKVLATRIKEVEENLNSRPSMPSHQPVIAPQEGAITNQAPSMQRIMAKHPDLIPVSSPPVPVTAAAAQALQHRAELISGAIARKQDGTSAKKM